MKGRLYFNYALRSLRRGGSRTTLAVFCVTVGVMTLVALQLVGLMASNAFTSNIRQTNGGDLAVDMQSALLNQADLQFFQNLKAKGEVTDFTAFTDEGSSGFTPDGRSVPIELQSVTTSANSQSGADYPLVGSPILLQPAGSTFQQVLGASSQNALVTQQLFDDLGVSLGARLRVTTQQHVVLTVKVAGVLAEQGAYAGTAFIMLISRDFYDTASPQQGQFYNTVDITTTTPAQATMVKADILKQFPLANVTTANDLLQQNQQSADLIQKFLQVVALLALLIGGVGIVNTMQVLLRRRRIEIAMLKTAGYRRRDLYALFALEAGLLGLAGGLLGALLGILLSYAFKSLVELAVSIQLPFAVDWPTVGSGVAVGVLTALIFGLLPIVKAAAVRPQNVLRELDEGRSIGSRLVTVGLLGLLSLLFAILAAVIMNSAFWGLGVVYGTLIFLGLLSLAFALVVWILSRLPVPERPSWGYLLLVTAAVTVSLALTLASTGFGVLLLAASLLGYVVLFLPRTWKANVKLSLRNTGRQKTRTVTTLVALFVGVFAVGLILSLGQDLRTQIQTLATGRQFPYNVIVQLPSASHQEIDAQLASLPGLQKEKTLNYAQFTPVCINGQSLPSWLGSANTSVPTGLLSSMQGYNLSQYPNGGPDDLTLATSTRSGVNLAGSRLLNPSDADTTNVLAHANLASAPWNLKVGSQITIYNPQLAGGQAGSEAGQINCAAPQTMMGVKTLTIVGFYNGSDRLHLGKLIGSQSLTASLGGSATQAVYYLKINPNQVGAAIRTLGRAAPDAFLENIADFAVVVGQVLNDIIIMLTSIAALALLAGVIIIANTVGLAMLERRRELGILKAVGYTSRTVLGQVILENGVIGGLAGLLAMVLVGLTLFILSQPALFGFTLAVSAPVTLAIVLGSTLLAMVLATLVAFQATRVRPLEVLRYE